MRTIRIRAHHIPSVIRYFNIRDAGSPIDPFATAREQGYGDEYINNQEGLLELLYANTEQRVKITDGLDDFCSACTVHKKPECRTAYVFNDWMSAAIYGFPLYRIYRAKAFHGKNEYSIEESR